MSITFCVPQLALQPPFRTFLPFIYLVITDVEAFIISTLIMAPIEMVQYHPPTSLPVSNTPPDSPGLPVAILSDDQVTEMADAMAAMKVAPSTPSSHHCSCQLPPGSPPPSRAQRRQLHVHQLPVLRLRRTRGRHRLNSCSSPNSS